MKKKCKRKVWPLLNTITFVKEGIGFVEQKDLDKLRLRELLALENMVKGKGTVQDWKELVDVTNLTQVMSVNGVGHEAYDVCIEAEHELLEAARRYERTKKMGLTGKGIQAIRDVIEYAGLQQASIPRCDFERMIIKTREYVKNKGVQV